MKMADENDRYFQVIFTENYVPEIRSGILLHRYKIFVISLETIHCYLVFS